MKSKGRADLDANLKAFWGSWMKEYPHISAQQELLNVGDTRQADQACLDAWHELVKEGVIEGEEKNCVLLSNEGVLSTSGSIMTEPSLIDYLQHNLHKMCFKPSKEALSSGVLQSRAKEDGHSHQHGTWKKLGLGSLGSAIGLGSTEERPPADAKREGDHRAIKGKSEESTSSSGVSWGGIGQWFGISSSASDVASSGAISPSTKTSTATMKRRDVDRAEVDLASLHSALDSELGGSEEQDAGSHDERFTWTQKSLWAKAGTVAITVHYTIVSRLSSCDRFP